MTPLEIRARMIPILGKLRSGRDFLPLVNDTLVNPSWDEATLRILIVRLSGSEDVEESISHLVLFRELRAQLSGAYLDFAFMPDRKDRKILADAGLPGWHGIASFARAGDFDVILVSSSYVPELLNLPLFLDLGGFPLSARDRRGGEWPLVLLGGAAALMSQSALGMVDALYTAEFELVARDLAALLHAPASVDGDRRSARIDAWRAGLRTLEGMAWLDGEGRIAGSRVEREAGATPVSFAQEGDSFPVLNNSHAGTVRLMVSLGCPFRCSFCFEGAVRKPYSELPLQVLTDRAARLRVLTGAHSVDLLSFNFNTHRSIMPLMARLVEVFPHVHLMSQRLDILYRRPELLQAELASGKRSFTLGIEGISSRMRRFFRKDLAEESIQGIVSRLIKAGAREIKCFYIVAGCEDEADFAEFRAFAGFCMEERKRLGNGTTMLFSFGYLALMPHTPLSRLPVRLDPAPFRAAYARLQAMAGEINAEIRLAFDEASWITGQVMSLASREDGATLLELLHGGGTVFDGTLGGESVSAIRKFLSSGNRTMDGGPMTWQPPAIHPLEDFCPTQVLRNRDEGWAAVEGEFESPRAAVATAVATAVGESPQAKAPDAGDTRALQAIQQTELDRRRQLRVWLRIRVPRDYAGACREWTEAWVSRRILALKGGDALLRVSDCWHESHERKNMLANWWGHGLYALTLAHTADCEAFSELLQEGLADLEARVLPEFDTAPVQQMVYRFCPQAAAMALQGNLQKALEAVHVPATLQRTPEGFRFVVAPKVAKKAVIRELRVTKGGDSTEVCIHAQPRLNLKDFMKIACPADQGAFVPVEVMLQSADNP